MSEHESGEETNVVSANGMSAKAPISQNYGLLLFVPGLALLLRFLSKWQFADYDLFARTAVGRLIVRAGSVPIKDPFAFTKTKDIWFDHEWLSGLVFYLVSQLGGDVALFLFDAGTLTISSILLFCAIPKTIRVSWSSAVYLVLLLLPSLIIWAPVVRAQVFSVLFFSFLLFTFSRLRLGKGKLLLGVQPLVMLAWANAHGGFVVGLGFIGLITFVSFFDKGLPRNFLLLVLVLCIAAPLFNPYGTGYLWFIIEAVFKNRAAIDEWQPVPLSPIEMFRSGHSIILFICAILVYSAVKVRRKIPPEAWLFLCASLLYGLRHQRLMPFFYCTAVVYGASGFLLLSGNVVQGLNKIGFSREALHSVGRLSLCSAWLYVLFTLVAFGRELPSFSLRYGTLPVHAMEWLDRNTDGGNILAHFNRGSFVLWRGYPKFKVAIDGRYEEVYPDSTFHAAAVALNPEHPNHENKLDEIGPDYILFCGEVGEKFTAMLKPEWQIIYQDENCWVLSKLKIANSVALDEKIDIWQPRF